MEPFLDILYQISSIMLRKKTVSTLLEEILSVLGKRLNSTRGAITLLRGNMLTVESTFGFSDDEKKRAFYQLGEGITGKVALNGKAAIIPNIALDERFLNRSKGGDSVEREQLAFMCVPVRHTHEIIGTLSIHHTIVDSKTLEDLTSLLTIVANMLADAIALLREQLNERSCLQEENVRLRARFASTLGNTVLIGKSAKMQSLYAQIERLGKSNATVLIRGEIGVGKIFAGRALHATSSRAHEPFDVLDCTLYEPEHLERELFGSKNSKGHLELTQNGTLFLNEFHLFPMTAQLRLLRMLEQHVFSRNEDHEILPLHARLIFSTSALLEQWVSEGRILRSLYDRIMLFEVMIPPLREHRIDIPILTDYFLEKYNKIYLKNIKRVSPAALSLLMDHTWNGNVKELDNCIERAVMLAQDDAIGVFDLPPSFQEVAIIEHDRIGMTLSLKERVDLYEQELIQQTLKENRGNVAKTARQLKTTPRILRYKIQQNGIRFIKNSK